MTPKTKGISRRKFISHAGCAALGYTTLFSTLINMKAIAAAVADKPALAKASGDYRALVCVLLSGGADSHNILIPRGSAEHQQYALTRSNLAIPVNDILPLSHSGQEGRQYGIHPGMPEVQNLFNQGRAAFVANVGTLIQPTNKEQYQNGSHPLPAGLFSHSDQIQHWQTGRPGERNALGWGGRMADLMASSNTNQNISMNISLSGRNQFQNGQQTVDYAIKAEGNVGINGYDNTSSVYHQLRNAAIDSMLEQEYQDLFEKSYVNTLKSARDGSVQFNEAIDGLPDFVSIYPDTNLAKQFKMVAKVIAARETLGFSRQTFFINFGGWDHHDAVLENQAEKLPALSAAIGAFYETLDELDMANNVTTFTISDFSRTLTSNGNGSDHGWGGNALVVGGSVNGAEIYGQYPELFLDHPLMLRRGSVIPSTSAAEYIAEVALWFGVSPSDVNDILPDLSNFYNTNNPAYPLGFLNPIV